MSRSTDVGNGRNLDIEAANITKTVRIDENGTFFIDPVAYEEFGLSYGDLAYMVSRHRSQVTKRYDELMRYYKGKHTTILSKQKKGGHNPDNRVVLNYAKQIVRSYVGYFAGVNPSFAIVKNDKLPQSEYEAANQYLDEFTTDNDINHFFVQQAKNVDIFGRSLALVYQDEVGKTRLAGFDPRNGFIVYADDVSEEPVFGVRYKRIEADGSIVVDVYGLERVYSEDDEGFVSGEAINWHAYNVTANSDYSETSMIKFEKDKIGYKQLPLIEFMADDERMGLYEDLLTVFDAIDSAVSEKKNDVDYFGEAILFIRNMVMDRSQFAELRDKRILKATGATGESEAKADYLSKPTADQTQENLINRLIASIYDISGVVNLNDKDFTNAASGQALKQRLQGMRQNADTKSSFFQRSFKTIFTCLFNGLLMPEAVGSLAMRFKKNEPLDVLDESQALVNLSKAVDAGVISKRTAITNMSYVEDADDELERIETEQEEQRKTLEDVGLTGEATNNNN